jgi:hypothetical protein
VHQERRERQVEVEWMAREIDAAQIRDAYADVLRVQGLEPGGRTDDLPVEGLAVLSGLSAEDDQQRTATLAREGRCFGEVVVPGRARGGRRRGLLEGEGEREQGSEERHARESTLQGEAS